MNMNNSRMVITKMLYALTNQCNPTTIPMGAIYAELSAMLEHGYSEARAERIITMAKMDDLE